MCIRLDNTDDMRPTHIAPFGFSNFQHYQPVVVLHIEVVFPRRAQHVQLALPVLEAVLQAWGTLALPRVPGPLMKHTLMVR